MALALTMKRAMRTTICLLAAALLAGSLVLCADAKSYSSGSGRSYSSHSSSSHSSGSSSSGSSHSSGSGGSRSSGSSSTHSSGGSSRSSSSVSSGGGSSHSSGGTGGSSKGFTSSQGRSYSSGSSRSDSSRQGYTSGKSYSAGSGHSFSSSSGRGQTSAPSKSSAQVEPDSSASAVTFDRAAARARKEEASKTTFTRFKERQAPPPTLPAGGREPAADGESYRVQPPPIPAPGGGSYRARSYVPDPDAIATRSVRVYNVFNPYSSRPWVTYNDPYNSLFWWWLLDRSLDDRASWAYHHRHDMDPARYQALIATDQQLEARVQQLESEQAPRDPSYAPAGLDRDLMYSDQYVKRAYSNRPTTAGVIAFWVLAIPTALAVTGFFIWLIWFKRWQTAT